MFTPILGVLPGVPGVSPPGRTAVASAPPPPCGRRAAELAPRPPRPRAATPPVAAARAAGRRPRAAAERRAGHPVLALATWTPSPTELAPTPGPRSPLTRDDCIAPGPRY